MKLGNIIRNFATQNASQGKKNTKNTKNYDSSITQIEAF